MRGRGPLSENDAAVDASIDRVRKGTSIRRAFSFLQGLLPRLQHFNAPESPRRALEPLNARPSRRRPRARAHAVFIKVPAASGGPRRWTRRASCGPPAEAGHQETTNPSERNYSAARCGRRHSRRSPGDPGVHVECADATAGGQDAAGAQHAPSGSLATCAALRWARSLSTRGGVVVACTAGVGEPANNQPLAAPPHSTARAPGPREGVAGQIK